MLKLNSLVILLNTFIKFKLIKLNKCYYYSFNFLRVVTIDTTSMYIFNNLYKVL